MPQRLDFDFAAFYRALSSTVAARDTSWKAVSDQTGVSQSTLSRMSKGRQPDAASLMALSAWSGINPVDFTAAPKNDPEAVAMVSRLLRADPDLDEDSADALEAIITTAYERLKRPSSNS
jgi:transcriptional regulator with XRE-family HTH domain